MVIGTLSPILSDIGIATLAAAALAFLARVLGQPLVLAYVAAGVVLGDAMGVGLVTDPRSVEAISSLGLILLLFLIGLEIDVQALRRAGKAVFVAGLLQAPLNLAVCLAVPALLETTGILGDLGPYGALYLAFGLSLSSTLVVVKLLYDKGELDTLPGRITLGVLVFQDLWAILFLAVQPSLSTPSVGPLLLSLAKGAGIVAGAFAVARYGLPAMFRMAARTPELVLLCALAWCFLVAGLALRAGLSAEMGALVAGVSVSSLPYRFDVAAKVTTVRDFFLTLFFVSLGLKAAVPTWVSFSVAAAVAAFVLVSRFVVVHPMLRALGRGDRAAIVASMNLWPVSEFALVLTSIGLVTYGHVTGVVLDLVLLTTILTAVAGTYLILGSDRAQRRVAGALRRLGVGRTGADEAPREPGHRHRLVLLGFHRIASALLSELERRRPDLLKEVLVVDFNPVVLRDLSRRGVANHYGDLAHPDTLAHAGVGEADVAVCTVPDTLLKGTTNLRILAHVRRLAPNARIATTAETTAAEQALLASGAAAVLVPPRAAGTSAVEDVVALLEGLVPPSRARSEEVRGEVLG
jgi:Kef-type K+ transport system membrane component KefB